MSSRSLCNGESAPQGFRQSWCQTSILMRINFSKEETQNTHRSCAMYLQVIFAVLFFCVFVCLLAVFLCEGFFFSSKDSQIDIAVFPIDVCRRNSV